MYKIKLNNKKQDTKLSVNEKIKNINLNIIKEKVNNILSAVNIIAYKQCDTYTSRDRETATTLAILIGKGCRTKRVKRDDFELTTFTFSVNNKVREFARELLVNP